MKHSFLIFSLSALITCQVLSGCTTTEPDQARAEDKSQPMRDKTGSGASVSSEDAGDGFVPACLNVVENDRRVEFDKSQLVLAENGKPKKLQLDDGESVRCEKLRIIENAREPSVEIVFLTKESGSSINVIERKMGIASIKTGNWLAQPLVIDRLFRSEQGADTKAVMVVKWSEEKGLPVLTRTLISSDESETIRP